MLDAFALLLAAFEPPRWVFGVSLIASVALGFGLARALASLWRSPDMYWRFAWPLLAGLITASLLIWPTQNDEGKWSFLRPPRLGVDLKGGVIIVYQVLEELDAQNRPIPIDIARVASDISLRVNETGLENVLVRPYGEKQIEIIVPDIDKSGIDLLKKKVETAGALEFRIVCNSRDHVAHMTAARRKAELIGDLERRNPLVTGPDGQPLARWVKVGREEKDEDGVRALRLSVGGYLIRDSLTGKILDMNKFYPMNVGDPEELLEIVARNMKEQGVEDIDVLVAVDDGMDVTGDDLKTVRRGNDNIGNPQVEFSMKAASSARFGALTGANTPDGAFKRQLGIVLDGALMTAPNLNSRIADNGEISGNFTEREVDFYVSILRAGRLSATIEPNPISQNEIGPALGLSTIRQGSTAISISLVAVLIFTLFYYRFAGVVACMALLGNLAMTVALMILLQAPLTLPGLAGLVLTVGMSVDANVLIFERIREELNGGASLRMAIRNGFGRATTTIVDANLTTLFTALLLYGFGTDQIKGFAVTLVMGIAISMFTAIYCSRTIFELAERRRWITQLSMTRALGNTSIDFLSYRSVTAVISLALIVVGVGAVALRGRTLLDIDFNGGVSVQMLMKGEGASDAEMREKLDEVLAGVEYTVTRLDVDGQPANAAWKIDTAQEEVTELKELLAENFPLQTYSLDVDQVREASDASQALESDPPTPDGGPSLSSPAAPSEKEGDSARVATPDAPKIEDETPKDETPKDETDCGTCESVQDPDAGPDDASPTNPADGDADDAGSATDGPQATAEADGPAPQAPQTPRAVRTEAVLDFGDHPVQEAVIRDRLAAIAAEQGVPELVVDVQLSRDDPNATPDWRPGMAAPFRMWEVALALPRSRAQPVLDEFERQLSSEPVWLASNKIGGKVASDMTQAALSALFGSLAAIIAYIWFRFQKVIYGLAAVLALAHDVLITLGAIALSAYVASVLGFLKIEEFKISLPVVAAFLTIIGYSLNDTIVVFDRIREVKGKSPELTADIINTSVNQTLSRTLLTSLTTLIVVLILYFIGGPGIHSFAFALLVGVIVGTYSSIFVASPALLWLTENWADEQQRRRSGAKAKAKA